MEDKKKVKQGVRKLVYINLYASGAFTVAVGIAYYFGSLLTALGFAGAAILTGLQGLYLAGDEEIVN